MGKLNGKQFTITFCFLWIAITHSVIAQNQDKADSLVLLLTREDTLSPLSKMVIYDQIAANSSSPDQALLYANRLLEIASKDQQQAYVIQAMHSMGAAYRLMGNLKMALEYLFKSADLAIKQAEHSLLINTYLEIANTYTLNKDFKNALIYNKKAIEIIREHGTKQQLAINLLNTGYNYYTLNELNSALLLYNEAEPVFDSTGLKIGKAYTIGNRALVYWKQKNIVIAEKDLLRAINMLIPLDDQFGMADYHNQLGRFYAGQGLVEQAISHAQQALNMATKSKLKEQIRDAYLLLSELHKTKKNYQKAFDYKSLYIIYKDSIETSENTIQLANLRTEFEVSIKEQEIAILEKNQLLTRIYIIVIFFLLVFAILLLLYLRQRFVNARLMAADEQKQHDQKIRDLLNGQQAKTLQSMVKGQENERKRLAQELHNHFGSLLATIKVNINSIDEKAISNHHVLTTLVGQACADIRNLSHAMNMGISKDFGLIPALKELTAHLQQAKGLKVEFSASMSQEPMSFENEIIVYRIVQELVSNVLKHAEATKLAIQLTYFDEENIVNILVEDNGKGFDPNSAHAGMGLKSLIELVTDLEGDIRFDSNPASGTTVNIDLLITPSALI